MNVKILALVGLLCISGRVGAEDLSLRWCNGDSLPGEIVSLQGNTLKWSCPLFTEQIAVGTQTLRSVTFAGHDELVEVDGPFRADTTSGDILYGRLTDINDMVVSLKSERHGTVTLNRSELVSLSRLANSLFIAPGGLSGWKTLDPDREIDQWRRGIRGCVETRLHNAELFRRLEVPELTEVELVLSWQQQPAFVFSITREDDVRSPESVTIETWDDQVVVVKGKKFEPVQRLSKTKGKIHLRIYLDLKAGQITVCSQAGGQLAQISGQPLGAGGKRGFYLRNKRSDLALETLRIASWSGQLPVPVSPGENRIHLIGGRRVEGVVKSYNATDRSLLVEDQGKETTAQVDQLDVLYFSAAPRPNSGDDVEISFQDGALLRGKLNELSGTAATLQTNFSDQPVNCKLDDCREINWPTSDEIPPTGGDVLYWDQGRSHGVIAAVDDAAFPVGWKATGSNAVVPLNQSKSIRLMRRDVKSEVFDDPEFPDIVYLTDFTVLRCHVATIGEFGARITTPFNSDSVLVVNDLLKAVEFHQPGEVEGFGDKRWTVSGNEDAVNFDAEEVSFTEAGKLSHPSVLNGSEVRFKLAWDGQTQVQMLLRLFAESVEADTGPAVTCLIYLNASNLTFVDGQRRSSKSVRSESNQAEFVVTCIGKRLVVTINGQEMLKQNLDQGRPARGIDFVVSFLGNIRGKSDSALRISDFSVHGTGAEYAFFLPDDVKEKVLTIPRLRKSNPPRHAIAAPNGDVLRGELVSVDADKVKFRSKLRDLEMPRERVAGIIWFHEAGAQPARSGATRVLLANNGVVALDLQSFSDDVLTGRSGVFGESNIPKDRIREIHLGDYSPPDELVPYADWQLRDAVVSRSSADNQNP